MVTQKHQCASTVLNKDDQWGNRHPCSRSGLRFEDDQWWCKTHAPSAVKARDEAGRVEFIRKWEEEREAWRRGAAMGRACAGLTTDALEAGVVAEMLAACKALLAVFGDSDEERRDILMDWATDYVDNTVWPAIHLAVAALAKAEQKEGET